jgi:metal-responsive CopG/Arc/MetJ family transcriptional regulator
MRKDYTTVKIPTELAEKLDFVSKDLGYASRAEIVNDAIRRFIEARIKISEPILPSQVPLVKRS